MQLLFGHDSIVLQWAGAKLQTHFPHGIGIGVVDAAGGLRGAFVLEPWNQYCAELNVYSEQALTRAVLRDFCRYVFDHLHLARLQAHTERNNKSVKRGLPKIGCKWDGVAKNWYRPQRDGLRFYLTPADCKWIEQHGQQT